MTRSVWLTTKETSFIPVRVAYVYDMKIASVFAQKLADIQEIPHTIEVYDQDTLAMTIQGPGKTPVVEEKKSWFQRLLW